MGIKIFDSSGEEQLIDDDLAQKIFAKFNTKLDPRVSSCVHCNSCVVACEPFEVLVDTIRETNIDSEPLSELIDFIENATSVHLYVWEENNCTHTLWLDPLFSEWSNATGEKRIRHN